MRWFPLAVFGLAFVSAAQSEDIVDVLRRSQQQRLAGFVAAPDGPRTQTVQRSFDTLRQALPPTLVVAFHVITGETMAETVHGHIIVANESLAELAEGERLFILAHELGHVANDHWLQMGQLYTHWVPGEVTPEVTGPVAALLGREASGLAHRQEYEADAFAVQMLRRLGRPPQDAISAFMHLGVQRETATHPATGKRVASLRAVWAEGGLAFSGDAK